MSNLKSASVFYFLSQRGVLWLPKRDQGRWWWRLESALWREMRWGTGSHSAFIQVSLSYCGLKKLIYVSHSKVICFLFHFMTPGTLKGAKEWVRRWTLSPKDKETSWWRENPNKMQRKKMLCSTWRQAGYSVFSSSTNPDIFGWRRLDRCHYLNDTWYSPEKAYRKLEASFQYDRILTAPSHPVYLST